jgi:peptidyl-prolyl cis-trans isomerase B (cyclophilin B)
MKTCFLLTCLLFSSLSLAQTKNPTVVIETTSGEFEVELNQEKAPITVANFLKYVDDGFYAGTIFHRVIDNFMIQGGGMDENMKEKKTRDPIKNEAANGLKNDVGTIAMARTSVPDSASSQFFINVSENTALDYQNPSPTGIGYAVFGKVTKGMDIVNRIKKVKTGNLGGHSDVPMDKIVIKKIRRK